MINFRRLRWARHVANIGEGKSALKILTVEPIECRPFVKPRRRWDDNIRMDLERNRNQYEELS